MEFKKYKFMKVDKIEYVIESDNEYMYMYVICV